MEEPGSSNPYAAPASVEEAAAPALPPLRLALRWTGICGASAIPSFFFGMGVCQHPLQIPLMLFGVLCFAFTYTMIAQSEPWRRLLADRVRRGCVITAYGCRIGFSVFLPIGWANDLFVGMISVQGVGTLFGGGETLTNPWRILLTTLVQGVLLNVQVFLAILLFIGISRAYLWFRSPKRSSHTPASASHVASSVDD